MIAEELKNKKVFALIDCNNFYVSCERVFNPLLKNKAVGILSNNDGCIVSRSNELKALGIEMGTPVYKIKSEIIKYDIKILSSNYALYGDMSSRVMTELNKFSPNVEIYSIDEAFVELSNQEILDYNIWAKDLKLTVLKNTGIPVSVGIGYTKTQAKIASKLGKKNKDGVFSFIGLSENEIDEVLLHFEIRDIWGIGRRLSKRLEKFNIYSALDLKRADSELIRKNLTVTGLRTKLELMGISSIPLEVYHKDKKSIAFTRSFGTYQENLKQLTEAVSHYTSRIAESLRKNKLKVSFLQIFITTNYHNKRLPQYSNSIILHLSEPTNITPLLLKASIYGLNKIFKKGYKYKKAGVIAMGLIPEKEKQLTMFIPNINHNIEKSKNFMIAIDKINTKFGKDTIRPAVEGFNKEWWMKQTQKSNVYTTSWNGLLEVE